MLGRILIVAIAVLCAAAEPWLDVPYVRQEAAGCGAASIAMVMQYWLREQPGGDAGAADGDRIYSLLRGDSRRGISGEALRRYLDEHNFRTFVVNAALKDIREHLAKGRPLVVCLAPGKKSGPLHYVVMVGATDDGVYFHDPARGKLIRQGMERFQKEWKATGNWMLLAVPREGQ